MLAGREAGAEAALIRALRCMGVVVARVLVSRCGVPVVRVLPVDSAVAALVAVAVLAAGVLAATASVFAIVITPVSVSFTEFAIDVVTEAETATVHGAEAMHRAVASSMAEATVSAAAAERLVRVPIEGLRDLLERCESGREILGRDGIDGLRADALDDVAEAVSGCATLVGERPLVADGDDQPASDEIAQLECVEGAPCGHRAVDDVEQSPIATAGSLVREGEGGFVRDEAIDGLEPVAERAGVI